MSQKEYKLPPVRGIQVYSNDVVVRRFGHKNKHEPGKRGAVKEFTLESRKRLAFIASNTQVDFTSMITLTYPDDYPQNGKLVKRDRKVFLQWLVAHVPECSYLWFIEFQKRGAPHFHILFTEKLGGLGQYRRFQLEVAMAWNNIVKGDYDHLRQGTHTERLRSPEGGRHYCIKYAQKMRQKNVPAAYENVGRFYGYSRDVKPKPVLEMAITWEQLKLMLGEWDYLPDKQEDLYRVLFNTSGIVAPKAVQQALPMLDWVSV